MSSSAKKRLTLTRTSVKDKMLRLLDQILFTTDELRQMINRHIGAMPETEAEELAAVINASAEVYPPPPIRIPAQTRKKRESKGPEVSVLPNAASSPLAQNVKEAILNVKDPNPELTAELKKITCPGGPAAFNVFRKRLAELFNQAGVTVTYDRMLEIAGPLYKTMCQNPIYVGTGRDGKPGVPFDEEQLAELQKGLERTQSLLRLSPDIMERIAALANGASLAELAPLTNATMSLQRQRAETKSTLGVTQRGKTRKVGKTVAAAAPSMLAPLAEEEMENQAGVSMLMPGAVANTASKAKTQAKATTLGIRIPQQVTKLKQGLNASIANIENIRTRIQTLGATVPRIKTRVDSYSSAAEKELRTLKFVHQQLSGISPSEIQQPSNKNALKSIIKSSQNALASTQKEITKFKKELEKVKAEELKGDAKKSLTALLNSAAATARNATRKFSATSQTKEKAKKAAKFTTPSGAVYAPGVSVGAVKPGPSYNPFNSPSAANNAFAYENTNEGQAYRKVQVKNPETGETGSYLMNSEGYLYDPTMGNAAGLNNAARENYMKGSYNKNTGTALFI
jgi:hypothetical protein